jgi:hypothetical protein
MLDQPQIAAISQPRKAMFGARHYKSGVVLPRIRAENRQHLIQQGKGGVAD